MHPSLQKILDLDHINYSLSLYTCPIRFIYFYIEKGNVMFRDFFSDPVLYMSFGILSLTILLGVFYTWYFISHVVNAKGEKTDNTANVKAINK